MKTNKFYEDNFNPTEMYKINRQGQRCDELKKNHDGLHILFAGCSVTMGEGIFIEETWSNILYNKINNETKCSGYFNVAQSGMTRTDIIRQVVAYIEEYGPPDYLFISWPDVGRGVRRMRTEDDKEFYYAESVMLSLFTGFLEARGVRFFSFSWVDDVNSVEDDPIYNLKNFSDYNNDELDLYLFKNKDKSMEWMRARDFSHPGVGQNRFWSELMYNAYINFNGIIEETKEK